MRNRVSKNNSYYDIGARRCNIVRRGTMLQAGRSSVRFPIRSLVFSIYLILGAALGPAVTQPPTEMSTRSRRVMFLGSRVRPVCKADSLTAIGKPTAYAMWGPRRLTTHGHLQIQLYFFFTYACAEMNRQPLSHVTERGIAFAVVLSLGRVTK
jgi:hypothetical protein